MRLKKLVLIDDRAISVFSLSLLSYKSLELFFGFFVLLHVVELLLLVMVR